MAIISDTFGNPIEKLDNIGGQSLIDTRVNVANLSAQNAEVVMPCFNTNSCAIEVRGTFSAVMVVQYTINGTDYDNAPIFVPLTELFIPSITLVGKYVAHLPSGTKKIRVLMSSFTSGTALVSLRGSEGDNIIYSKPLPNTLTLTSTAAINTATTLTLPAGGTGFFQYINRIIINKYVGATLTPVASPVIVTTTNINGTPSFNFKTLGNLGDSEQMDLGFTSSPLKSLAANTATTIVAPATTGVIWKITAFYYIGA